MTELVAPDAPEFPAPLEHRTSVTVHDSDGFYGIVLQEESTGALMHCENPVEVTR